MMNVLYILLLAGCSHRFKHTIAVDIGAMMCEAKRTIMRVVFLPQDLVY